jgi:hypothetical protein
MRQSALVVKRQYSIPRTRRNPIAHMKIIQCSACRRNQEPEAFQRNKRGKYGRHHRYRSCERQRDREQVASGKLALASRLWKSRHTKRAAAHAAVPSALRRGELLGQAFALSGESRAEVHHLHYAEPLCVLWLCRRPHAEEHRIERLCGIGQALCASILGGERK